MKKKGALKYLCAWVCMISLLFSSNLFVNAAASQEGGEEVQQEADITSDEGKMELEGEAVEKEVGQDLSIQTYSLPNEEQETSIRDTVLLLDISDSMAGTPLDVMKQSAVKFCETLLSAEGTNRIGLVVYDYNYRVYDLTSDIESIRSIIEGITLGSGTNIYNAFVQADIMLSEQSTEECIKNIVLMTDGVPLHGETDYSGPYTSDDHSRSYPYANAAYKVAVELQTKYNIYSLGFFHTMDETTKEFATRFLNDVQNTGYYEVIDPNDLEIIFGELAEDIVKEDNKCPIVIVPGVMGSRLYSDAEGSNRVWEPDTLTTIGQAIIPFWNLSDDLSYGNILYTYGNNINQVSSSSREYGATEAYKDLVDFLCEKFPDREIYFFSYDFRESNKLSAEQLNQFINSITGEKHPKVDVVCHSMGGLVASSYVAEFGSERIRRIVTMGTPYEGAPKLLNSVLNWDVLTNRYESEGWDGFVNTISDSFLGLAGLQKKVKAGFPAIAELAPTESYLNNSSDYFYRRNTEDTGFLGLMKEHWYEKIDYEDYSKICGYIFGNNYKAAEEFHESVLNNGLNVLASLDNSYFALGVNQYTIAAVAFNDETSLDKVECTDLYYENEGDGTVPYDSATMIQKMKNIENSDERYLEVSADHNGIVKNQKALDWLYSVLNADKPTVTSDNKESSPYVVIRIACPIDVSIEYNGETLSSGDIINNQTEFGRLDIIGENDDIKMICMDENTGAEVIMNGTGTGEMTYAIRWYSENGELEDERIFNDVPINEETVITTNTEREEDTVLFIDTDGDNQADEQWTAESNSYGTESDDQEEPPVDNDTDTDDKNQSNTGTVVDSGNDQKPDNNTANEQNSVTINGNKINTDEKKQDTNVEKDSEDNQKSLKNTTNVRTGDTSILYLICLAFLAIGSIAVVIVILRKKNNYNE